jgi:hypothetical protein
MSQTKIKKELIDASFGTDWVETIQTSNFTAAAGKGYFVDTTSGEITVTLPIGIVGTEIVIQDYAGTFATNKVILNANGSEKIQGSTLGGNITTNNATAVLIYQDATKGWTSQDITINLPLIVDYLVVAGGGGTGFDVGGGGGAGGLRTSYGTTSGGGSSAEAALSPVVATNYSVTVGAGGGNSNASNVRGTNGNNSIFSTITSIGGGGGGSYAGSGSGLSGGSGGGGAVLSGGPQGGAGTANQGYAGGAAASNYGSAGGGGAGGIGPNGVTSAQVDGGAPLSVNITGASVNYAGGGYGNCDGCAVYPTGNNRSNVTIGIYGFGANGAGSPNSNPYPANDGIVILRFPNSFTLTASGGLTSTTATDGLYTVTSITAGTGTISFS